MSPQETTLLKSDLGNYVRSNFESFKHSRKPLELIWEKLYYNYNGQYQPGLNWKAGEGKGSRSRIFVRLTSLKSNTAHSMLSDSGLPAGEVPFNIEPMNMKEFIAAGATADQVHQMVELRKKRIDIKLKEGEVSEAIDMGMLDMCIFGTGILKGPISVTTRVPKVQKNLIGGIPANEHDPRLKPFEVVYEDKTVLMVDTVPIWEYFVDANAKNTRDSIGEGQFQRLLPQHFLNLALMPGYDEEAMIQISQTEARSSDADDEWDYKQLGDNYMGPDGYKDERISLFEFQGLVPVGALKEHLQDKEMLPKELRDPSMDSRSIEALVTIAGNNQVIRALPNLTGYRQYMVCPYKKRPHSIYGVGPAEDMMDSQQIINSAYRLMIDNKRISGVGMLAAHHDSIDHKRTKKLSIDSGKTIYLKGNKSAQDAVTTIKFTDVSRGLQELINDARRFADEETGLPSITSGNSQNFLNKTARGMAMLQRNANRGMRTVMRNVDDNFNEPIVERCNQYIVTQEGEQAIPLKIKARGIDSLMAKELQLEDLLKFLQLTTGNSQDALMVDRPKLLRQIASLLDVDAIKTDEQIQQATQEIAEANKNNPAWMKDFDVDKIYPDMVPQIQAKVLQKLGILDQPPAAAAGSPAPQQVSPGGRAPIPRGVA